MKTTLTLALSLALSMQITAQRYHEVIFPSASVERDIQYGTAPNYQGVMTELMLDIYQPDNDNAQARALVVLVHGGGFTGGGKAGENFQVWGMDLAQRGFVVASIEYRLGVTSKTDAKLMWEASLRCGQDTRAAVRFLRSKMHDYRIDTSHIFLIGTSAGGFGILQASILQDNEIPSEIDQSLGGAEGNSGTPNESSKVHGLVVCWGATTDTTFIDAGDPPLFAVHGTADKTVPYQCGPSKFGFDLCGGLPLTTRAANMGITSDLLLFPGAGHTLDGDPVLIDSCYRFAVRNLATLADAPTTVNNNVSFERGGIVVYPNPVQRGGVLTIQGVVAEPTSVVLVDILGHQTPCAIVSSVETEVNVTLPTVDASSYYLVVSSANGVQVAPVRCY